MISVTFRNDTTLDNRRYSCNGRSYTCTSMLVHPVDSGEKCRVPDPPLNTHKTASEASIILPSRYEYTTPTEVFVSENETDCQPKLEDTSTLLVDSIQYK